MKQLLFRTAAAELLGLDPRTLVKRAIVQPIGSIEIQGREFAVYDKAGIEELQRQKNEQERN